MYIDKRAGNGGVVIHQLRKLLQFHWGRAQFLVLDDVLDLCEEAGIIIAGEKRGIDAKDLGNAQENRHGQRADVVFNLVDVTGGKAEGAS